MKTKGTPGKRENLRCDPPQELRRLDQLREEKKNPSTKCDKLISLDNVDAPLTNADRKPEWGK